MNTDLLFQLYAIHSPSKGEKKMRRFIRNYILNHCGDVKMETDSFGNLLCTKGESKTYPCLASHMDQVQRSHSKDFKVLTDGVICIGYSLKNHEQQGLGADDKNGIFICLECLETFDVLKVAFFVGEESGCVGSSQVDLAFFKDCRFIIEPDRRGAHDLITSMCCGSVCSKKFIEDIHASNYDYKEQVGSVTDVGELTERNVGLSCLNLSCGYYEAHTDTEFTILPELENCLFFVTDIIEDCTDVYPFEGGYGGYRYDYGRYGLYSYSGYGKSEKWSWLNTDKKSTSIQTEQKSQYQDNSWYDDDLYYWNSGYYDEDMQLMEEYLQIQPDLAFEQIMTYYLTDFHAYMLFDKNTCEDMLSDLYYEVSDRNWWKEMDEHDDEEEHEEAVVTPLKKVS